MLGRLGASLVVAVLAALPAAAQDIGRGTAAYGRGDYAAALREMGPLAAAGNARAQNLIGLMFHKGHGVPIDHAEAAMWYRRAADQGYASAQYNLGLLYLRGHGVAQGYAEAAAWFRKAAAQGHTKAQYNLAVMYLRGDGVTRNQAEAETWLNAAAAQGHAGAKKALRLMRESHPEPGGQAAKAPAASAARNEPADDDGRNRPAPARSPEKGKQATTAPAAGLRGDYRVQLGSVRSEAVAREEAARLNRVHAALLGGLTVAPVRADLGERGVFYRLRAGPLDDRDRARSLCREFADRNQACIVVKR